MNRHRSHPARLSRLEIDPQCDALGSREKYLGHLELTATTELEADLGRVRADVWAESIPQCSCVRVEAALARQGDRLMPRRATRSIWPGVDAEIRGILPSVMLRVILVLLAIRLSQQSMGGSGRLRELASGAHSSLVSCRDSLSPHFFATAWPKCQLTSSTKPSIVWSIPRKPSK